jgi:hypothetical protein
MTAWLAPSAVAQSTYATLTGVVADQSGGVLPGATVTVTNRATNAVRTAVSGAAGEFQVPNLDAGTYHVSAHLEGFADVTRDVELLARQTVRVDVQLFVASAAEHVDVRAVAPVIETERATIDSSKSGADISKLALNFRATNNTSPIVVATLSQGVQQDRAGSISVAGALPFMTSFSVDGISTQRVRYGGPSRELFPSVESIEEFKVASAGNSAEFMQLTDLTTTTKGGTNQMHGTGFWFNQNSALGATSQFTPKDDNGDPIKPHINANSFGLSGGGPVVRNRTFFFGTYEGVRRPNEVTLSELVPPDAWRTGNPRRVLRPSESEHGGCDQRAQLHHQRPRRLHGQRVRRPRGRHSVAEPEGLCPIDLEEHRRPEPERQRLEHDARRSLQAHRSATARRGAQLDSRRRRERGARWMVEYGRKGHLHECAARSGPRQERRPRRSGRPAGHRRLSAFRICRRIIHFDRRRQAVRHSVAGDRRI